MTKKGTEEQLERLADDFLVGDIVSVDVGIWGGWLGVVNGFDGQFVELNAVSKTGTGCYADRTHIASLVEPITEPTKQQRRAYLRVFGHEIDAHPGMVARLAADPKTNVKPARGRKKAVPQPPLSEETLSDGR